MPEYGRLSKRPLDEMIAGARVDVAPYKRDAMDFVLWKPSGDDAPGWDSPWGRGRPGWHIECSAMATRYLGHTLDIHTASQDLMFPHHENEIAIAEALTGKRLANYWLHSGQVMRGGRMSNRKSCAVLYARMLTTACWSSSSTTLMPRRSRFRFDQL